METCANCRAPVTGATAFLTESGTLCNRCFAQHENAARQNERQSAEADASHWRGASLAAYAHGVIWAATVIFASHVARWPSWIATPLVAATFGLAFAMRLRRRRAYQLALALDLAGALTALGAGMATGEWFIALLALFPLFLARFAYTLLKVFARGTTDS